MHDVGEENGLNYIVMQLLDGVSIADRLDRALRGVDVKRIATDDKPPIQRFDPGHPDANEEGYVAFPNVSVVDEMSNLMSASRAYEANLVILRKVRAISEAALRLGR